MDMQKKEYPTLNLRVELEFLGSVSSLWRILISVEFVIKTLIDMREYMMQKIDIVTSVTFLQNAKD
jgi:hypothetical protein